MRVLGVSTGDMVASRGDVSQIFPTSILLVTFSKSIA